MEHGAKTELPVEQRLAIALANERATHEANKRMAKELFAQRDLLNRMAASLESYLNQSAEYIENELSGTSFKSGAIEHLERDKELLREFAKL